MSKPDVVVVPGAWHRPAHFERLVKELGKAGYNAVATTLASVDSSPPAASWDVDAQAAREVILKSLDAGKDVIVVGHSYGGIVMSEAAKNLGKKVRQEQGEKSGILRLIYMCAVAAQEGRNLVEMTAPVTEAELQVAKQQQEAASALEDGLIKVGSDREGVREAVYNTFYNRCDPKDAEAAFDLLGGFPVGPMLVPVTYTAYREIPSTYIVCENDHALLPTQQERMIAASEGALHVERCQEGHSPYISNPSFIVDCVRRATEESA